LSDEGKQAAEHIDETKKMLLAGFLRNNSKPKSPLKVHRNVEDLLVGVTFLSPIEAADKFLLYLDERSGGTSNPISVSQENDFPLFYLREAGSMNTFMQPLQQTKHLIDYIQPKGWFLTYQGHERVAELKKAKLQAAPVTTAPAHADLWEPGMVRVFLSHLSADKVAVGELKDRLQSLGVSAFVAHADIVPSLPWLQKIENALESADCLVALMVPGFKDSLWTDHEVGIALGRRIPVLPVMLGSTLYGFIASRQGFPGDLTRPGELALSIVESLIRSADTESRAVDALAKALERSSCYIDSLECAKALPHIKRLTETQVATLTRALANSQVTGAHMIAPTIERTIARVKANAL
jgi:hypothetical protein